MAAVSDDGRELLVMVNNLAGERRDDIALDFSAKWHGGKVERLEMDGSWSEVGRVAATTKLGFACEAMVPEFVRVTGNGGRQKGPGAQNVRNNVGK